MVALNAAISLHDKALLGVLDTPLSWIESQPIGRLLNRFSSDVQNVDLGVASIFFNFVIECGQILASVVLVAQSNPLILTIVFLVGFVSGFIYRFYQSSNIELKRLVSNIKSPVDAHTSESMAGIAVIKSFRVTDRFITKQFQLVDGYNSPRFLRSSLTNWIQLRLSLVTSLVTFGIIVFGSIFSTFASAIGLSLTVSIGLSNSIMGLFISIANVEAEMNSVERLSYYGSQLPREAPRTRDSDPLEWPSTGSIEMQNVEIRYPSRPDHVVINSVSLSIAAGEKIGVCGRTGSGKSTLATALFRILELSAGTITIDHVGKPAHVTVDIATIGLKTLRSKIQMIPQDPTLFDGTVRSNLDPDAVFTDEELWNAIDLVGLKPY
ncbi:hypothetical protein HDU91_005395, partial [Kappamyces sp. JEL0680]